jgi:holo-[acyl-carrier protein] synthase
MKIANGVDLIEIARVKRVLDRHGDRFLARIFTERERLQARGRVEDLAIRFAAKEAISKALGTGLSRGIRWQDLEVVSLPSGQPTVELHGRARERAEALGLKTWSISLSHSRDTAVAVVTAIG